MDADLLGLDDEGNNGVSTVVNNIINNNQGGMNIFDILGNLTDMANSGGNSNGSSPNLSPNIINSPNNKFNLPGFNNVTNSKNNEINIEDFGFVTNDTSIDLNTFDENSVPVSIFDPNSGVSTNNSLAFKSNDITVYSSFNRENASIKLGLFIINKSTTPISFVNFVLQISISI
jgi:hypothetical protein